MDDYPAELYAALHLGNPGDVAYYAALCEGASSVLELGVGAGRVAAAIAPSVDRYVGIDLHEGLLNSARLLVTEASLIAADMCDFDTDERFDRVIAPYNGLYCLLSEEALLQALRRARALLNPGGIFAFDVYDADDFHDYADPDEAPEAATIREELVVGDQKWRVDEISHWDRRAQRIKAIYTHTLFGSGGKEQVVTSIEQRYLRSEEFPGLLERAGFSELEIESGFGEPSGMPPWVVRAR